MSDRHKITIRCDHVTRTNAGDGKRVTPRIAVAHYRLSTDGADPATGDAITVAPHDEWAYTAARAGSITDPPLRDFPAAERALRSATQMQTPRNKHLPNGPDEQRIAIACLTCRQRVVALKQNLDVAMNKLRHADIHTVSLSHLRANL